MAKDPTARATDGSLAARCMNSGGPCHRQAMRVRIAAMLRAMDTAHFETCLRRARAGDREALDQALQMIKSPLELAARHSLRGQLRGHMDTSDVVQTTYVDILRAIGQFKGNDAESFARRVSGTSPLS